MARKKIIAGNWKMNKTPSEAVALVKELTPLVKNDDVDVVKAPRILAHAKVRDVPRPDSVGACCLIRRRLIAPPRIGARLWLKPFAAKIRYHVESEQWYACFSSSNLYKVCGRLKSETSAMHKRSTIAFPVASAIIRTLWKAARFVRPSSSPSFSNSDKSYPLSRRRHTLPAL